MSLAKRAISILRRLSIIVAIGVTFLFGLATTVYLSLRSPEVKVPEVIGKDRFEAERILGDAGLNFRVRATRPSNQSKADTVLFQLPRAGDVVKVGQTVAMDISRTPKEGEAAEGAATDKKVAEEQAVERAPEANENKPKRRPANKNANDNANGNNNVANRNVNANRAGNVNARTNSNANTAGDTEVIGPARNNNQNANRRAPTPRPTPAARNANVQPPNE